MFLLDGLNVKDLHVSNWITKIRILTKFEINWVIFNGLIDNFYHVLDFQGECEDFVVQNFTITEIWVVKTIRFEISSLVRRKL